MSTEKKAQQETVSAKIKKQRLAYEAILMQLQKEYELKIKNATEDLRKAEKFDYAKPYEEKYMVSLLSLETLYSKMDETHTNTQGLTFHIGEYIKQCKTRSIPNGSVEEYFEKLVREGRAAIQAVRESSSIEDDIEPLKQFCQVLVDLRYLEKNARRLIEDANLAKFDRVNALTPLQARKQQVEDAYADATQLEHLSCYPGIKSLKDEIEDAYNRLAKDILRNEKIEFKNREDISYRFLVGFYKDKVDAQELDFATGVMGVEEKKIARYPIYFDYTPEHSCILIKAPTKFLASNEYNDFIRNLYFKFASQLPPRQLLFGGVECDPDEAVVGGLGDRIQQLDSSYVCHEVEDQGSKLSDGNGTLALLREMALENSKKQRSESVHDIFEYNKTYGDNPQKFSFLCVNNYPAGFNAASSTPNQWLQQLAASGSKGIIAVICQNTDGNYRDVSPDLTTLGLNADCIEFNEQGEMTYNGRPADPNITGEGFQPREYWNLLGKYFKSAASIRLDDLFKSTGHIGAEEGERAKRALDIPIGKSDGDTFNMKLDVCTDKMFGIIIGTIGSGKSAFLHTLILSAARHNSPEDLQFYLADFKAGSGSTEFSHYRKIEGKNNLYIPHVRYLLLKGKTESAFDLLDNIEAMVSERTSILTEAGYSQLTDYNASEEVLSGKKKKLPYAVFVIDEYNAMLNGAEDEDKSNSSNDVKGALATKIKRLISRARSYGIGIILCGQSVDPALKNGQALGNMGCRISLPVKSDSELISLFDLDSYDARKKMQQLAGQGDALVSLGRTANLRYVRTAYSGQTNGEQQLKIAQEIRDKYAGFDYDQTEAGSEDAVLITEAVDSRRVIEGIETAVLQLNMGVSSASALPVPLVYSTTESAVNYYACANRDKLCKIERNAMFAFLYEYAGRAMSYHHAPVTYLAMNEKKEECLGTYFEKMPWLHTQIDTITNKTDIAQKIIELRRLYRERKHAVDTGAATHFDPMFVVLRDVAWLNDKDAEWLPDFDSVTAESEPVAQPAPASDNGASVAAEIRSTSSIVSEMGLSMIESSVVSEMGLSMIASRKKVDTTVATVSHKSKPVDRFTVADVKTALAMLYAHGSKYNIFLLVSSEIYKPISDMLVSEADDKNIALKQYGIFGSFIETGTHAPDPTAPKDCIYINYFNSKTRLYDYTPDKNVAWWNAIQNKISSKS